jgi:uroporphyrinogen-III synthase
MSADRPRVLLLREAQSEDPYVATLALAGMDVLHQAVLRFSFVNQDEARAALRRADEFGGVILTSPRAAKVFANLADPADWQHRRVFVVGSGTAELVRRSGFEAEAEESGTGSALAEYILTRYTDAKPLLFLAGNRRRPELFDRLTTAELRVKEVTVYETEVDSFDVSGLRTDWIVFFSPSGVDSIAVGDDLVEFKIAAIGETTAAELEARGVTVDATAKEPTPAGLLAAIRAYSD